MSAAATPTRSRKARARATWPKNFLELSTIAQEEQVVAHLSAMRARAKFESPDYEALLYAGVALKLQLEYKKAQAALGQPAPRTAARACEVTS
ncbi:MAG: hypothetical protein EOO29_11505 [Comamonadaceae bacterium]|nr:MAG: hypothetical protein EOO29_11505 [Comamonadaceae bacterium]